MSTKTNYLTNADQVSPKDPVVMANAYIEVFERLNDGDPNDMTRMLKGLIAALEQADKALAEARVLLSTRVEAPRLDEANRTLSEQSATIEAVTKWRHVWFDDPVDGVSRRIKVQCLDETLDRNHDDTAGEISE
jgi:hypothetical protein